MSSRSAWNLHIYLPSGFVLSIIIESIVDGLRCRFLRKKQADDGKKEEVRSVTKHALLQIQVASVFFPDLIRLGRHCRNKR